MGTRNSEAKRAEPFATRVSELAKGSANLASEFLVEQKAPAHLASEFLVGQKASARLGSFPTDRPAGRPTGRSTDRPISRSVSWPNGLRLFVPLETRTPNGLELSAPLETPKPNGLNLLPIQKLVWRKVQPVWLRSF